MKQELFYVWNVTDKILANPDKMTKGAAEIFVRDWPKQFYVQGYYKTASGSRIDPDNVILVIIPAEELEKIITKQDDFSDIRDRDEPDTYMGPDESWHWHTYNRRRKDDKK